MFKYRDEATAKKILDKIRDMDIDYTFMHVCGTHQDTIVRFGLEELLKDVGVEIRQGPGCPVCVTTSSEIADAITLARNGVTVCAFGSVVIADKSFVIMPDSIVSIVAFSSLSA